MSFHLMIKLKRILFSLAHLHEMSHKEKPLVLCALSCTGSLSSLLLSPRVGQKENEPSSFTGVYCSLFKAVTKSKRAGMHFCWYLLKRDKLQGINFFSLEKEGINFKNRLRKIALIITYINVWGKKCLTGIFEQIQGAELMLSKTLKCRWQDTYSNV